MRTTGDEDLALALEAIGRKLTPELRAELESLRHGPDDCAAHREGLWCCLDFLLNTVGPEPFV